MTKRKDGRWQESVIINGKRKYFYGRTKSDVLRSINAYKEKELNGMLFTAVADLWWEEHEPEISYNSTRNYKPAYERAKASFEGRYINSITPAEIASEVKSFARTHAQKTVDTQLLVYRLIFAYAVREGYAQFNAARDISIGATLETKKRHMPSKDDIKRIKGSADCTFGLYPIWAMYTGMRKGELLALTWDKVDIPNRRIMVDQSVYHVGNSPHTKEPKTEKSLGYVPILDALLKHIHPKKNGLVFPDQDGNLYSESRFRKAYAQYQSESGVTCTSHQLRHAFAVMLFEANIPPERAQVLLRHAQISTTMDIYTELRDQKRDEIFTDVQSVDIK